MEKAKLPQAGVADRTASDPQAHEGRVSFHFDAHLVMNGLNRIASRYHAKTGEECEDLFELADYLKYAFQLTPSAEVSLAMEARLLEHYLRLLTLKTGRDVALQIGVQAGTAAVRVRPHSACDVLGAVLGAVALSKVPLEKIAISLAAAGPDITLVPDSTLDNRAERLRDLQHRLDALPLPGGTQIRLQN